MQCPRCGTANPARARFCLACGAKLGQTCPQCGRKLPRGARFCLQCGAGVAISETAPPGGMAALSQAVLRQIPREYAERLLATRGQPHDERRTVTILFSDIKGSTAMISQLDPEDAKEVVQGAFEFLIAPIFRYEGTLVQLMGDAILAFFGAPIAHEDDPERACRAALEITAEAAEYAERIKRERGIEGFSVRVGINTGLVVVGEVGSDLRVAYTAVGDAINVAARMEQNAEPGRVLITAETHRLVAPLFDTQAMPPLTVKGHTEPVSTYRVLAARPVAGKVRGIAGLESPLVGREAELAALQEVMERLRAGVGGIVTIVGEAGLGKSRLVAEVRRQIYPTLQRDAGRRSEITQIETSAGQAGARRSAGCQPAARGGADYQSAVRTELRWVEGRCLSCGTSVAYLPWLDVLRGLLGVTAEDSPGRVQDMLRARLQGLRSNTAERDFPYLARLMALPLDAGTQCRLRDLDGHEFKAATFAAVEALLACAAGECPLAIVLEDMHWADPTSLELLQRLLALTEHTAVLFLCLFRPQPDHGSWRIRETAARRYGHHHTDLWLHPLSTAESEALLGNLLGLPEPAKAYQDRVLRFAEGNPFYVEEILRALIDHHVVVQDGVSGTWRILREVGETPVPETLQGVLLARIDHLQEDTRRVLQMAAVIGRIFLYRVLAAIAAEEQNLDHHLSMLQREEMIRERARMPELEYIFKHELMRDAAYHTLLKKERRAFHRQVAEALERLYPERIEGLVGLLSYHWERAADTARATHYLRRAGDQACLAYANEEAVDYFRRALALLEETPPDAPARQAIAQLYESLGDVLQISGKYDEARGAYESALAPIPPYGNIERARLQRKIAEAWTSQHRPAEAMQACNSAQAALGPEPAGAHPNWWEEWVAIQLARIEIHYFQRQAPEITGLVERVGPSIQEHATTLQRSDFFSALVSANNTRDRFSASAETLEFCRANLEASEQSGSLSRMAGARFGLGFNLLWHGEPGAAKEQLRAALELAVRVGTMLLQARCLVYLAVACRMCGQVEEAGYYARRSLEAAELLQNPHYVAAARANLAWQAWRKGDLSAAVQLGQAALELWQQPPTGFPFQWLCLWPLLALALAHDEIVDAVRYARLMLEPAQQALPQVLTGALDGATGAWESGESGPARVGLARAVELARTMGYL